MTIILSETELSDMTYRDVAYAKVSYCDNRDNVIDYEIFDINSISNDNATNWDVLNALFNKEDFREILSMPRRRWLIKPYKAKVKERDVEK